MKINFPPARILTVHVTGNYEFSWEWPNNNLFIIFVEYISEYKTEEDGEENKVKSTDKDNYM